MSTRYPYGFPWDLALAGVWLVVVLGLIAFGFVHGLIVLLREALSG